MSTNDVRAGEARWLQAFNGGDASAVAGAYTTDARLMGPNMDTLEGRPAIEAFIKEFVATGAKLSFDLVKVHETPELCVAVGRYEMDIPGAPKDLGKYVEVWARQSDGSWQIVDDIFNSSQPAAAAG